MLWQLHMSRIPKLDPKMYTQKSEEPIPVPVHSIFFSKKHGNVGQGLDFLKLSEGSRGEKEEHRGTI